MNDNLLFQLFEKLHQKEISAQEAMDAYSTAPFQDLGFAKLDHHRSIRSGSPEVIFGEGKSKEQVVILADSLLSNHQNVLVTRASAEQAEHVHTQFEDAQWDDVARVISICRHPVPTVGRVGILSAGTADAPVAQEAMRCASFWGLEVTQFSDVGVAGLHRLLNQLDDLRTLPVLIVVAGMDGALPSVVAGLLPAPVIAVPTSVGYGTAFSGVAPLLSNLNACAAGVTVVNIDNGFGAARAAHRILHQMHEASTRSKS